MHEGETTEAGTLEAVLSRENLRAAWLAVKANQGAAGVDGMGRLGSHLAKLLMVRRMTRFRRVKKNVWRDSWA